MQPQEQAVSPNVSFANLLANPGTFESEHSQQVLKRFTVAIKKVVNEHGTTNDDETLTQDELIQLIRTWEPQRDIVCLYVRWSRQLRRNFNLDSIATLLCLSRQCGYTPLDFLRKVKTLSVLKNKKAVYGISFNFDNRNRKDINRERLNKEFLGLSVTLALLQEQVTHLPSILGKTKMRHTGPRNAYPIALPVAGTDGQAASVVTHPNIEFHTQTSLLNRIWLSIKHRWLALYFTEHLFREADQPAWSFHDGLIISFQMMASCGPSRYEFLSPLVGLSLRFPTQESINSKRTRLREIWKDPTSLYTYGNQCLTQFTSETQSRIITSCFHDLRSDIPSTSKQISYQRDCAWARRWNILRAYIFHFWLDSVSNSNIKSTVVSGLSPQRSTKHKSSPEHCPKNSSKATNSMTSSRCLNDQSNLDKSIPQKRLKSGLHSITSSRLEASKMKASSKERVLQTATSSVGGKIGHSKMTPVPVSLATLEKDGDKRSIFQETDWSRLRLISLEELDDELQSYLLIHRADGVDVVSCLSPLEVYSANNLHDWSHCRMAGKSPFFPPSSKISPVHLHVRADADHFVDISGKSFHVAREHSTLFNEHSHHLPSMQQILVLCKAISLYGKVDTKRAPGQLRLNIGNGGQNWIDGAPCQLHGLQFEKVLHKDNEFDVKAILQTIGALVEFTWRVACDLQEDALDAPLAPDKLRKQLYADYLNKYLYMDEGIGFEDITLVISSLHPIMHEVYEHKDSMNDCLAGYTRTTAFNLVMIEDSGDVKTIIHFQVICNFRKVIGCHVVPFHGYLSTVAKNCRTYLDKFHRNMHSLYAGRCIQIPTAFDRSAFFLDDCLEFATITISECGKHKQTLSSEYLLTEVNVSRTLSMSMFIDPLVKLQGVLKFDQTIELALACSFLSNPFWFDWTMSDIIKRLNDSQSTFKLGIHPFYDWSHTTIETFGAWQGGPYNRWSPCGGSKQSVIDTFGAHPNASKKDREHGEKRLGRVVSILFDHMEWINSMAGTNEIELSLLKERCNRSIKEIADVASCQFSHFRLGILTTILSGCGLLKPGKHLRFLMYPVKGSASYKHLSNPTADCMSRERACALIDNIPDATIANDGVGTVAETNHDLFMRYLSIDLGYKVYLRDQMECILCESHPMRSLNCRDWYRKGMALYDINDRGEIWRREYGGTTKWMKLAHPESYQFAYLGTESIQYIPIDSLLTYLAAEFGEDLRANNFKKVRFKGRSSKTSSHQRLFTSNSQSRDILSPPSMQIADFYLGSQAKQERLQSMFVLGDAEHPVEIMQCNDLERIRCGRKLHKHLNKILCIDDNGAPTMAAGCYHMDSELTHHVTTFFPGHLDKPFVHTVWFVPLGSTAFFTVLAVRKTSIIIQDHESLASFHEWMEKLSMNERQNVNVFLSNFDSQAKKYMKQESVKRIIYLNKRGSVLSFPANQCFHATITPKKPKGYPRDMFIFHPLDGIE